MSIRLSRFIPFFLSITIALTGCGVSAPKQDTPSQELSGAKISVVTTYGPNDGGHEAYNQLCAEFNQTTGIEVIDNSEDSTEEWKQRVLASFKDGTEPDVLFFFTGPDVEELNQSDKFVSIEEIRKSFPDYASNINLTVLEGLKAADGKGYGVPVKGYWERLFVNKDIFDELGLPLPEEYDDLFEIAPSLIDAGYIPMAASLAEVPHYLFEAFLFNHTGPSNHHTIPTDPDNPPQSWISALEQFQEMYDAGMFPNDEDALTHADAFELFQSKKAAMVIDGDWSVAQIRDTENTVVVNFPSVPDGPRKNTDLISGFSMGFYISKKAWDDPDKRDAATAFVQFITSNDSIMRLNVSGAAMPIAMSASGGSSNDDNMNNEITPLRRSIDELNEVTTAFVSAAADEVPIEARAWLFGRILPLSKGEVSARDLLSEFISLNNEIGGAD